MDHKFPMTGIELWRNPKNQFVIYQIHYSADEKKQSEDYWARIKASMPIRQYLQEYELQWESFAGLPVYEDYNEEVHGVKGELLPQSGLPLLRGWDFGLTPACVVAQLQGDVLVIMREFVAQNMSATKFVPMVLQHLKVLYPEWVDQKHDYRDYIDPAGYKRSETDMTSCANVLTSYKLNPFPGPVAFEPRRTSVEHFLTRRVKDSGCLQLSLQYCPVLARGFKGGYRYPDRMNDIESMNPRPLKDEHSHPHDALQYVCAGVKNIIDRQDKFFHVPSPHYTFMDAKNNLGKTELGPPKTWETETERIGDRLWRMAPKPKKK